MGRQRISKLHRKLRDKLKEKVSVSFLNEQRDKQTHEERGRATAAMRKMLAEPPALGVVDEPPRRWFDAEEGWREIHRTPKAGR